MSLFYWKNIYQKKVQQSSVYLLMLTLCLSFTVRATSTTDDYIQHILQMKTAPVGVVFEVVQREDALRWVIPAIQQYAKQLRVRFPQIKLAVVSHGGEQFSLLKDKQTEYSSVQKAVQQLVTEQDIVLHVCGTHAAWYHKQAQDFPDYVDVVSAGPTQIENYEAMGYLLVDVLKPVLTTH